MLSVITKRLIYSYSMVAEICRYSVSGNKNLSADTPVFNQSEFRIWFGLVCAWRNPTWKFLSGLEKVIYQMKKIGFRLQRFTSESEVVAALSVQGGLVKNKMKGGPLNKMTIYISLRRRTVQLRTHCIVAHASPWKAKVYNEV